jgi:GNAT superfamily N-acetyltransferase
MAKASIRPLEPRDMGGIAELMLTRPELTSQEADLRTQQFEWIAFKNPFARGEPTYFIAEEGGKVFAHLGRMPLDFATRGKRRRGYFAHDLYVHPEFRARGGLGFMVTMGFYKAVEQASAQSFCCFVWTSPLNLQMQRRRKYHEIPGYRWVKLLDVEKKIQPLVKSPGLAGALSTITNRLSSVADEVVVRAMRPDVEVEPITRFDAETDALCDRVLPKLETAVVRSSTYLNWKYADRTDHRMTVFAARRKGELAGIIVVRLGQRQSRDDGFIADILADPDDPKTLGALYHQAISHARAGGIPRIQCIITDDRFTKVLQPFLFLRREDDPTLLGNLGACEDEARLKDAGAWFLTYGDSDGFMLGD